MLHVFRSATTRFPLLMQFVVVIVMPMMIAASVATHNIRSNFPQGHIELNGPPLTAAVSIMRDENGVPHIEAQSDNDAFYAIGYVHAQDRLWQLELQRRTVQGRLSEVFGKESVQQDVWMRTLGLYGAAKTAWPALSQEARASLTAYTAGINAGMKQPHGLPLEFRILGIEPEPWTEIDSLAWIKMFALQLGGNFQHEISRYVASQYLNHEQWKTFFPDDSPNWSVAPAHADAAGAQFGGMFGMMKFQSDLAYRLGFGGRSIGSNVWVVSGKLTETGSTLLANDPHLGLQIPSPWYAISAKGKTLNVGGMGLVGLPIVIFGHNANIAWGGANMMADTQDLYLERPSGVDRESYVVNEHSEAFVARTEKIGIRADFPEQLHRKYLPLTLRVRASRHGPIISDQFHLFDHPVSLRWTALDDGDTSYEAFYRLNFANNWATFSNALHRLVAPTLNYVYADRAGNIGYLGAGRIPVRASGDGTMPSPGWNDANEWTGYIPESSWPQSFNPKSGYIINANNRMVGADYPYFISRDWPSSARAERIQQMLTDKLNRNHSVGISDMQRIQGDTMDNDAKMVMAQLQNFTPETEEEEQAWTYLKTWDGNMAAESQGAALFHVWMRHFRLELFDKTLHGSLNDADEVRYLSEIINEAPLKSLAKILEGKDTSWCTRADSGTLASCQTKLHASLRSAIAEIYKLKGDRSMESWRWGSLQQATYRHTPFSNIKPFDRFFEERIANGGSENSINLSESRFSDNKGYIQYLGASFRQLQSLDSNKIESRFMGSTGQSGDVMNPHYADMIKPFRSLQYVPLDTVTGSNGADGGINTATVQSTAGNSGSGASK